VQNSPSARRTPLLPAPRAALVGALGIALLAGCGATPVRSTGDWAEGAARDQSCSRLLVVGVSPYVNQRCAFEESLAASLRDSGIVARSSCREMGVDAELTRENVEKAAASFGADGVLATRLVDSKMGLSEGGTRETRGDAYYKPVGFGWGWDYWGAYGVPVVYADFRTSPSVLSLKGEVVISTALFETQGATAFYFVETRAKDLASREQALTDVTPVIAGQLVRARVVRPGGNDR